MDVRVIGGELQHKLLKVVLNRKWLENAQSSCAKKEYRTKVWKLERRYQNKSFGKNGGFV